MSITVVSQQMAIIFILIMLGTFLYKKTLLSEESSRQISGIIANFCNPALLISSVFQTTEKLAAAELLSAAILIIITYVILIVCGFFLPILFHVKKEEHYIYRLLTVFSNTGFIGIPLVSAVLGPDALIYVSINNLAFNILMYTFGISSIQKAKVYKKSDSGSSTSTQTGFQIKKLINAGTASSIITIILYVSNISVPVILSDTLSYIGRSTTFLSMLVLGVSLAQLSFSDFFRQKKLFFFTIIRLTTVPIGSIFLLGLFTDNYYLLCTQILMLALPAGSMSLILSKQQGVNSKTLSTGILLSTLLSLITISLVTLFV